MKRRVAKTAAASVDATTAPSRTDSSQVRSKSQYAATPVRTALTATPTVLSRAARHGHLSQPPPGGLQAALVEDRGEADDPDLAGELGVVELDPARAVRAEQHPEREEGDEDGEPGPGCAERDDDAGGEDRPDEEEHGAFVHVSYLLRWESGPPRGTLRGMATRPRTRKIGRLSEIAQVAVRHGFGYFFERHKLTDLLPWTSRVEVEPGRGRLRARPPPARDARRARPDVRQVRAAALDPARRRPAGHRRRAAWAAGRRAALSVRPGARGRRGGARPDDRAGVPPLRRRSRSPRPRSARCTARRSRTAPRWSSRCSGRTRRARSSPTSRFSTRPRA